MECETDINVFDNNRRYHDIMMKALLFLVFVWCKKLVILLKLEDSDGTSVSRWAVCVFCKPLRVLYLLWILSVVRIVITVWSVGLGARKLCVSRFSRTIVIPINLFCVGDHIISVSLDTINARLLNLGTHIYGFLCGGTWMVLTHFYRSSVSSVCVFGELWWSDKQ